nr:PP2C family protein-serine/threonine phosphatase [Acidobacteriota bacterium]
HGLRAGNMVVATKSLFAAYARHKDPAEMLSSISVALERLQFQNMFMALTIIQIQEDRLILSMGGMPPALVYRAADKTVERLHLKNIPLGVLPKFAYQTLETRMHPGDVMLLMTDGLMERFDPADDMFGLDRIVDVLAQSADRGPDALMDALMQAGDRWGNGRPTDDDITFLVLQRDG